MLSVAKRTRTEKRAKPVCFLSQQREQGRQGSKGGRAAKVQRSFGDGGGGAREDNAQDVKLYWKTRTLLSGSSAEFLS